MCRKINVVRRSSCAWRVRAPRAQEDRCPGARGVRIVAGRAKGRRLAGPADATRPTSDRTREAMFNSLAARIRLDGARVLDLYAGTGAVGLEALSRGAASAVLVEKNRAALAVLRRNVETVALPGAVVVGRPVQVYLGTEPVEPFDFVFADPPYDLDDLAVYGQLLRLSSADWLAPGGELVVERAARSGPPALAVPHLTFDERRYGDTVLWYGRRR
jgi:16S rRNA (guanine966-N2)-methyltransferase